MHLDSEIPKRKKIVAVIPAYNEVATIEYVVRNVSKYVSEVVVVDDFSDDDTGSVAKKAGAVVIRNNRNLGYDGSINEGFKQAIILNPDILVTFDADAQHDSKDILSVISPIVNGDADVVVGVRAFKQRLMEYLFAFYSKRKIFISDPLSGVKAYKSSVYKNIGYFDRIGSTGTQLMFKSYKNGAKLMEVPISFYKRKDISRFGRSIVGNFKIFISFVKIFLFN